MQDDIVASPSQTAGAASAAQAVTPGPAAVPPPARPPQTHTLTLHPAHAPTAPSTAGSIGGTLFALLLVLGLIFVLAWLVRRLPGVALARPGGLRVVAALPLSARERLLVVEVGNTQLLLSSGLSGTRLLHTLEQPLPETAPPPRDAATPFAKVLAKHFGKQT